MSHDKKDNQPLKPGEWNTDPIHRRVPQGEEPWKGGQEQEAGATTPSEEPRSLAAEEADRIVKICKGCMVPQRGGGGYCVKCGEELIPIRAVRDSSIGDVVGGKYQIVEAIGSGGMGDVYLGINETLGQRVAIKFLNHKFTSDEQIVLRFLNEARSYCKVNHPNAVTLLEYGQHDDGSLYLITEFIDGESLTEVVRKNGPLPIETIIAVGTQIAEVLTAAHGQGVIHRDLKPDNLMMIPGSRGRYAVKVLDFGIAKIVDDEFGGGMTETGSVFGTPEFMSPEQSRGESADPRSDLYALGILFYFMATGQLPFSGKNKFAILHSHIHDEPPRPSSVQSDIHPELEELILHCLKKERDERPQTADEIVVALESIDLRRRAPEKPAIASKAVEPSVVPDEIRGDFQREGESELGLEFDETELSDSWGGEFYGESGEGFVRGSSFPLRSGLIGLIATLVVVGGVIFWTGGEDSGERSQTGSPVEEASTLVWTGRAAAAVEIAAVLVEHGEFAEADRVLVALERQALSPGVQESMDELVRLASNARNREMQLRSALEAQRCQEAEGLYDGLLALSSGAARALKEELTNCGQGAATKEAPLQEVIREEPPVNTVPVEPSPAPSRPVESPEAPAEPEPERARELELDPEPERIEEPAPEPVEPPKVIEESEEIEPVEEEPADGPEPIEVEEEPVEEEPADGAEPIEEGLPPRRI